MLGCAYNFCSYSQISCTYPSGSPCPLSRVWSYTPSVLICCIRLLCDWWFHHCHRIAYICDFAASYLHLFWYDWFLQRCLLLLLLLVVVVVVIFYSFESFSYQCLLMVSHWSQRDSRSPQISRTLLSILADLNKTVVRMISTRPLISTSSITCTNPLVTVPSVPVITGITLTFMSHSCCCCFVFFLSGWGSSWLLSL